MPFNPSQKATNTKALARVRSQLAEEKKEDGVDATASYGIPQLLVQRLEIVRLLKQPLPRELKLVVAVLTEEDTIAVSKLSKPLKRLFDEEVIEHSTEKLIGTWDSDEKIDCEPAFDADDESFNPQSCPENLEVVVGLVNGEDKSAAELAVLPIGCASLDLDANARKEGNLLIDIKPLEDLDDFTIFRIPNPFSNTNSDGDHEREPISPGEDSDIEYFDYDVDTSETKPDETGRDILEYIAIQNSFIRLNVEWKTKTIAQEGHGKSPQPVLPPSQSRPFSSFKSGQYPQMSSQERGTTSPSSLSRSRKPTTPDTMPLSPDDFDASLTRARTSPTSNNAKIDSAKLKSGDPSLVEGARSRSLLVSKKQSVKVGARISKLFRKNGENNAPKRKALFPKNIFGGHPETLHTEERGSALASSQRENESSEASLEESNEQQKEDQSRESIAKNETCQVIDAKKKTFDDDACIPDSFGADALESSAIEVAMPELQVGSGVEADKLEEDRRVLDDFDYMSLESQSILSDTDLDFSSGRPFNEQRGRSFVEELQAAVLDEMGPLNNMLPTCSAVRPEAVATNVSMSRSFATTFDGDYSHHHTIATNTFDEATIAGGKSVVTSIPNPSDVLLRDVYHSCGPRMVAESIESGMRGIKNQRTQTFDGEELNTVPSIFTMAE